MPWDDSSAQGIQAHIDFLRNFLGSVSSASTTAKVNSEINSLMAVQQQALQQQQLGFQNSLASKSMALQASQAAAQMALANKEFGAQQAQIAFQNKLITDQLTRQHAYEAQVKGAVSPYLQGAGIGYDPQELALARGQFIDNIGTQFGQALANTKTEIARRGGGIGPPGGMEGRAFSGLETARAGQQAQGLREIMMANLERALSNKMWATQQIAGLGAGTVPNGYFGPGAAGAINVQQPTLLQGHASAPNPFDPGPYLAGNASLISTMQRAQESSGFGGFMKSFMGGLGGTLGGVAAGGIGNLFNAGAGALFGNSNSGWGGGMSG